jgi:hypothetical protein
LSRDLKAFLVAVPVAAVVASCSLLIFGLVGSDQFFIPSDWMMVAKTVLAYSIVMLPFVAFGGVLIGLPIALLLRRRTHAGPQLMAATGFLAGGLFSLLILGLFSVRVTLEEAAYLFAIGAVPGVTAAIIWWRVAERDLPEDQSFA